jgi:hypothetical protein
MHDISQHGFLEHFIIHGQTFPFIIFLNIPRFQHFFIRLHFSLSSSDFAFSSCPCSCSSSESDCIIHFLHPHDPFGQLCLLCGQFSISCGELSIGFS